MLYKNKRALPNSPLFRGKKLTLSTQLYVSFVWTMNCWFGPSAIVDGYMVKDNCYDNRIYCFGKGQQRLQQPSNPGVGNSITVQ
ncbi:MAG: hypothetical protein ACBZ72_07675 [Candidatus Bathyarchaeia archaeon]